MRWKIFNYFFLILFVSVSFIHRIAAQKGYSIDLCIPNLPEKEIILGHRFNDALLPDDTLTLNQQGCGTFAGDEKLPGGMYFIYLPNQSLFDVLLDRDQVFSIKTDTTEFLVNTTFQGSALNEAFYEYQRFLTEKRQKAMQLQQSLKDAEPGNKTAIQEQLDNLTAEVNKNMDRFVAENKDNFLSSFILATRDVKVPEPPKNEKGEVIDSMFQYKYYRAHYFDNFNPADPRLLRTPFYKNKIITYLDKVIPQIPDTLITEIDWLIEESRAGEELFRFMLVELFNKYAQSQIMGMDKVFIHIAENYYIPEAEWSDSAFIANLKEEVKKQKPLLIGNKAPDIDLITIPEDHFMMATDDPELKKNVYVGGEMHLYDVDADYTVLAFWEADCGHCKKTIPQLYKIVQDMDEYNIEVIAVHMLGGEEGKVKWVDFINEHGIYHWTNTWNPYSYQYKIDYAIKSSPVIFVLNEDKEIIAKKLNPEQVKEIITFHARKNKF